MPAHSQIYKSIKGLWAGYSPRTLPLESQVVREWRDNGIVVQKVYFTSEIDESFKVRVIAYYAFPASANHVPAVLHIHGGGQTASREYVEYWARRGYASLSIDWGGHPLENNPADGNTDWGPIDANQREIGMERLTPNTKANPWFHWVVACRRGITFLERQPQVDGSRIGIFGISMGGQLVWLVAGVDHRVKAAISTYGAVQITDSLPRILSPELDKITPEDAAIWRGALDPIAYAPDIRCPFFYLSATDDFYGNMDFVNHALTLIHHGNWWQSYTLHYSHHVKPEQSAAIPMFMNRWLKGGAAWPEPPRLTIKLNTNDHVPMAIVTQQLPSIITKVSIYYSLDPYAQSRFWRSAQVGKTGDRWAARLPLTVTSRGLYVFANVIYRSGLSLSTRLSFISPQELARTGVRADDPPTLLIDDLRRGASDWFTPLSSPNPIIGDTPLALEQQGAIWRIATRKIGDPKWGPAADAGIAVEIRTEEPNTLLILVTENELRSGKEAQTFVAQVPVKGGGVWETIRVPLSAFRLEGSGNAPALWAGVNLLSLHAQYDGRVDTGGDVTKTAIGVPWLGSPPSFGRIEWFSPK